VRRIRAGIAGAAIGVAAAAWSEEPSYPEGARSTQDPKDRPSTPQEALAKLRLPPGFRATLFAAEPHVAQPISLAFDDRGRLWVAECYSYERSSGPWRSAVEDRIIALEDEDGDGRFDRRTVFASSIRNLTSALPGLGGVWVTAPPRLLYIPDRDRDDVPDGEPEAILDGWNDAEIGHCAVNGLVWGPDGWLYGRQGIQGVSRVGRPGSPDDRRRRFNGGIWRYHPGRKVFEVVCEGTTNPWGLDFDEHGEAFFTNCVIGHLWHVVPGAHYERMYGSDFTPNTYELVKTCSDHIHWGGGPWQESRSGESRHDAAGGGHAHVGAMIYLGDDWPEEHRGRIFMTNLLGRRLNQDILERRGSGYVGRHGPDLVRSDDPWFRGISIVYGPDGGVYVSDWCDLGECHDNDGVHRESGRIYKIVHGARARPPARIDLAALPDAELVELQLHANDWFVRHARRLLGERAAAGKPLGAAHERLRSILATHADASRRLRALWALHVSGGTSPRGLLDLLADGSEHVRAWAVRLLAEDGAPSPEALERFARLGREDPSALVRLHLASSLQRIAPASRWNALSALLARSEDAADPNLPFMAWYALEPLFEVDRARATRMASGCRLPFVRRSIARRAAGDLDSFLEVIAGAGEPEVQLDLIEGLLIGLEGRGRVKPPGAWKPARERLAASPSPAVRDGGRALAAVFGEEGALAELRALAADGRAAARARKRAIETLARAQDAELARVLLSLLDDEAVRVDALRALSGRADDRVPAAIAERWASLGREEREAAIAVMTSRREFARALIAAVGAGRIQARDIPADAVRRLRAFRDRDLDRAVAESWGRARRPGEERRKTIADLQSRLTADVLSAADLANGRRLYTELCGSCHKLFGVGGELGPELTGSDRGNVYYLLENLLDPNAVVPRDFQMVTVVTREGRVVSGIVASRAADPLEVRSAQERAVIPKSQVEVLEESESSLMPEGLIDRLSPEELRDLVGWLRSPGPAATGGGAPPRAGENQER